MVDTSHFRFCRQTALPSILRRRSAIRPDLKPGSNTVHIRQSCRPIRCDIDADRPELNLPHRESAESTARDASGPKSRYALALFAPATVVARPRNEIECRPHSCAFEVSFEPAPPARPQRANCVSKTLRPRIDAAPLRRIVVGVVRSTLPYRDVERRTRTRTGNGTGPSIRQDASSRSFTTEAEYALSSLLS